RGRAGDDHPLWRNAAEKPGCLAAATAGRVAGVALGFDDPHGQSALAGLSHGDAALPPPALAELRARALFAHPRPGTRRETLRRRYHAGRTGTARAGKHRAAFRHPCRRTDASADTVSLVPSAGDLGRSEGPAAARRLSLGDRSRQ